jgi:hypothetical protein
LSKKIEFNEEQIRRNPLIYANKGKGEQGLRDEDVNVRRNKKPGTRVLAEQEAGSGEKGSFIIEQMFYSVKGLEKQNLFVLINLLQFWLQSLFTASASR